VLDACLLRNASVPLVHEDPFDSQGRQLGGHLA
jgi:hypothetical protein